MQGRKYSRASCNALQQCGHVETSRVSFWPTTENILFPSWKKNRVKKNMKAKLGQ